MKIINSPKCDITHEKLKFVFVYSIICSRSVKQKKTKSFLFVFPFLFTLIEFKLKTIIVKVDQYN